MKILTMQGTGDSAWALPKVQSLARLHGDGTIHLRIGCWNIEGAEVRAVDFLRRFPFLDSVEPYLMPRRGAGACLVPGPAAGADGIYRYIDDGPCDLPDIDYVAIPNRAIDRGIRLEQWLPEVPTNWGVYDTWRPRADERMLALSFAYAVGQYAVLFMSSVEGNTQSGWNRGGLWTPDQWVALGTELRAVLGVHLIVIGAAWDAAYYTRLVEPKVGPGWTSLIGRLSLCETIALIQRARLVVAYPSGIPIMAHYLRRPTAMFWRRHGDPIDLPNRVSPVDEMATAWTYPETGAEYLPCWLGETTPDQIVEHAQQHGW